MEEARRRQTLASFEAELARLKEESARRDMAMAEAAAEVARGTQQREREGRLLQERRLQAILRGWRHRHAGWAFSIWLRMLLAARASLQRAVAAFMHASMARAWRTWLNEWRVLREASKAAREVRR